MPVGNWNLQWLNHNSQRSYPLTSWANKVDESGTIKLPDNFIVALYLPVSSTLNISPDQFFIRSILINPTGFNVVIGYLDGGGVVSDVAAANIALIAITENQSFALSGIGDFDDTVGHIVIGKTDEILRLAPGFYTFDYAATALEADSVRPAIRGVSRLRINNNLQVSDYIYGDVTLVAGSNVRISVEYTEEDTRVIFDAVSGLNLNADCVCPTPEEGECIRCINGVCSDDGNFTLIGNECIEVIPGVNSLALSDVCAQPCCGCEELDELNLQIERFGDGVTTLQNFVSRLNAEVTQMSLVVLGSRLNDTGCN
jgi:hypothetical protein